MGNPVLFLNSERIIRGALTGNDAKYVMNDRPLGYVHRFFPERSILLAEKGFSPEHNQFRKGFTKGFNVYGDGINVFEDTVQRAIGRLLMTVQSEREREFDCLLLIRNSIISLISVFLCGEELEPSDRGFSAVWKYVQAHVGLSNVKTNAVLLLFPISRYIPGTYRDIHTGINESLTVIFEEFFTKIKTTYVEGSNRGIVDFMLTEQLNERQNGTDVFHTDERIKGVIGDTILAGVLTTVSSLSSMLLCILNHPDVQRRVQAEIHEVIGRDQLPTLEDQASCPYTEAVFLETQRYITVVPFAFHLCKEHTSLDGFDIPANTVVLPNIWRVHHDEKVWGDPWNYRPERFLDEEGQLLPRTHPIRKQWMPFGTGRRQCIGETFARSRIFLHFASLMQKWRFIPVPGKCGSCDPRSDQFDTRGAIFPKSFFCRVEEHEESVN